MDSDRHQQERKTKRQRSSQGELNAVGQNYNETTAIDNRQQPSSHHHRQNNVNNLSMEEYPSRQHHPEVNNSREAKATSLQGRDANSFFMSSAASTQLPQNAALHRDTRLSHLAPTETPLSPDNSSTAFGHLSVLASHAERQQGQQDQGQGQQDQGQGQQHYGRGLDEHFLQLLVHEQINREIKRRDKIVSQLLHLYTHRQQSSSFLPDAVRRMLAAPTTGTPELSHALLPVVHSNPVATMTLERARQTMDGAAVTVNRGANEGPPNRPVVEPWGVLANNPTGIVSSAMICPGTETIPHGMSRTTHGALLRDDDSHAKTSETEHRISLDQGTGTSQHDRPSASICEPVARCTQELGDNCTSRQESGREAIRTSETDLRQALNTKSSTSGSRRKVLLALDSDKDVLSEYQCFVRQQVYLFEVTHDDIKRSAQGRNKPIVLGQVGLICRYCQPLEPWKRPRASAYFPSRLDGIYKSAQNLVLNHFSSQTCQENPAGVREKLQELRIVKETMWGGGWRYWVRSARLLGVVEQNGRLAFYTESPGEDSKQSAAHSPSGRDP